MKCPCARRDPCGGQWEDLTHDRGTIAMTGWRKIADLEGLLRAQSRQMQAQHYSLAPKDVKERLTTIDETLIKDPHADFQPDLKWTEERVKMLEEELTCDLHNLSPEASLHLIPGQRRDFTPPFGHEWFSHTRCAWIAGVFAEGQDNSKISAHKFWRKYTQWCSTRLLCASLRHLVALQNGDGAEISERVVNERLLQTQTLMRWVTDEACIEAGCWVDENIPKHSPALGATQMRQAARNASATAHMNQDQLNRTNVSIELLRGLSDDFLMALTAHQERLDTNNLHRILESEKNLITPILKICGDFIVGDTTAWMLHRDVAVFYAIMRTLPSDRQGAPLEACTARLLNKFGPSDLSWTPAAPLRITGKTKPDDVDIVARAGQIALIGECKSNRLPENNSSVDTTFSEKILEKASQQLATRLDHWDEGWRIPGADSPEISAHGFIITLSAYGGAIWLSNYLANQTTARNEKVPIFPLHSLILVASIMTTSVEFVNYMQWRTSLLKDNFFGLDELEFMIAAINGSMELPEAASEARSALFVPYEMDAAFSMQATPRYESGKTWKTLWRQQVSASAVPVVNPAQF